VSVPAQLGSSWKRVLERRLGVLFAEEQVDRLRVSEFDEGVGAHESEPIAVRPAWLMSKTAVAPAASKAMTSQGTPHGRFQRAIHSRHVQNAEMAAREMGGLSLADALLLCELLAKTDPARYERAGPAVASTLHRRAAAATQRGCACCISARRTQIRPPSSRS
jgi:hypothetical protein